MASISRHTTPEKNYSTALDSMPTSSTMSNPKLKSHHNDCQSRLHRLIWRPAFKILCMVAVCKKDIDHWNIPNIVEWEKHVNVMINRFHYSNINAGLILATTAMMLSSEPPLARFIAYDTPSAYICTVVAFCAALLSVIFGAAVLVMYESCTAHKDMNRLKNIPQLQKIFLLLWLAGPSIYMTTSTVCMFSSVLIACFSSEYVIVKVIAALAAFAFLFSGLLTLSIIFIDKWSISAVPRMGNRKGTDTTLVDVEAGLSELTSGAPE